MLTVLPFVGLLPLVLGQTQTFKPAPGNFPAKGDGDFAGGIFSIPLSDLGKYANTGVAGGSEAPRGAAQATSGSGPYPAQMITDPSFPGHTLFVPKSPLNGTVPFIAWGNGACVTNPSSYKNFLIEIASYGYIIAADGSPTGSSGTNVQSKVQDMRDSLDWALKGGAAKYGTIDPARVATAGHSCGGLEAMSVAYHDDRVKRIAMFDIAIFQDDRRYLLAEIKVPVAYFIGGKSDMGYPSVSDGQKCIRVSLRANANNYLQSAKDYALLNAGLPALRANLDTGHGGTYGATNGGKFGKAAVAYFEWQFRNDTKAKAVILDPKSPGSLVSDNWIVEHKNWT